MAAENPAFPIVELNQAGNWEEFRAALKRPRPQHQRDLRRHRRQHRLAGGWPSALPQRVPRRCPLDGASGTQEWDGMIPFDELPSYFNPPGGMVVSANQNSFPRRLRHTVSGFFASTHRARGITASWKTRPKWTAEEMLIVQRDVTPASHLVARKPCVRWSAAKTLTPAAAEGARILKTGTARRVLNRRRPSWPRCSTSTSGAPWRIKPRRNWPTSTSLRRARRGRTLLRERPSGWFDDIDLMLSNELADAVEEAKTHPGPQFAKVAVRAHE